MYLFMYLFVYLFDLMVWKLSIRSAQPSYVVDNLIAGVRFLTEYLNLSLFKNCPEHNLHFPCLLAKLPTVTFTGTQMAGA